MKISITPILPQGNKEGNMLISDQNQIKSRIAVMSPMEMICRAQEIMSDYSAMLKRPATYFLEDLNMWNEKPRYELELLLEEIRYNEEQSKVNGQIKLNYEYEKSAGEMYASFAVG